VAPCESEGLPLPQFKGVHMADGKSKEEFRRRRLSLTDDASAALAMTELLVSPAGGAKPKRRMSVSPEMGTKFEIPLAFSSKLCGTYSCHGIEPGRSGTKAKINQDRGCIDPHFCEPEDGSYKQALFCVYDGHGAQGDKASEFTMRRVQELLQEKLMAGCDMPQALKEAFLETDDELKKDKQIDAELSGTTAVAMVLRETNDSESGNKREAWLAWCGDSRAVWGKPNSKGTLTVTDLTTDQKPDTPEEMARIKQRGGFVSPPEEEWGGPARVWLDAEMTLPGLAMARSIGDHLVKNVGVIAEPAIMHYQDLDAGIIVLASDGVWEFIDSRPALELVGKFIYTVERGATEAVTELIKKSADKWKQEEGDYRDDITAICIQLDDTLFASRSAE